MDNPNQPAIEAPVPVRYCTDHKEHAPVEEFSVNPKTGIYYRTCDTCRARSREYQRQWRATNLAKVQEYHSNYITRRVEEDPEFKKKRTESTTRYRKDNIDKARQWNRESQQRRYQRDPEAVRAYKRNWRKDRDKKLREARENQA
jgi:hypothetical protein